MNQRRKGCKRGAPGPLPLGADERRAAQGRRRRTPSWWLTVVAVVRCAQHAHAARECAVNVNARTSDRACSTSCRVADDVAASVRAASSEGADDDGGIRSSHSPPGVGMPRQQAQGCQLAPLGPLHANLFKTELLAVRTFFRLHATQPLPSVRTKGFRVAIGCHRDRAVIEAQVSRADSHRCMRCLVCNENCAQLGIA
jgi:hypothetical protein